MHNPVRKAEDPREVTIRSVENGYLVEAKVRDVRLDLHNFQHWTKRTYGYSLLTEALAAANEYFTAPLE